MGDGEYELHSTRCFVVRVEECGSGHRVIPCQNSGGVGKLNHGDFALEEPRFGVLLFVVLFFFAFAP